MHERVFLGLIIVLFDMLVFVGVDEDVPKTEKLKGKGDIDRVEGDVNR